MKREETVDFNIKVAWHAISRMYNLYGQDFDVTTSSGFVLLNIDVENGTPATKIAPMVGLESRSLTRILKAMEEKNWIYREKDPEDGRSVRIFLTDLGRDKREVARASVKEFNKRVMEKVSKEELVTFFRIIQHINALAEDKEYILDFVEKLKTEVEVK
jgi:DNA-binding MarR family transcriptional regulator